MKLKIINQSELTVFIGLILIATAFSSSQSQLQTPAEINRYTSYTTHAEIGEFLSRVDYFSENVQVQTIGETLERDDLYLVHCATGGKIDTNKVTFSFLQLSMATNNPAKKLHCGLFVTWP